MGRFRGAPQERPRRKHALGCGGGLVVRSAGPQTLTRVMYEPEVRVWNTTTGHVMSRKCPGRISKALAVSADGFTAAVCVDATVYLWSLLNNSDGLVLPLPLRDPLNVDVALAVSPDGARLAWAGAFSMVSLRCTISKPERLVGPFRWRGRCFSVTKTASCSRPTVGPSPLASATNRWRSGTLGTEHPCPTHSGAQGPDQRSSSPRMARRSQPGINSGGGLSAPVGHNFR